MADRHKTPTLSIRPTADQRAAIIDRAAAAGMSVNAYLLTAALSGSDVAPAPPPRRRAVDPASLSALQTLRAEVGKLGNVVNQLARAAYLGKLRDGADVGPRLQSDVAALADAIRAALNGRAGE